MVELEVELTAFALAELEVLELLPQPAMKTPTTTNEVSSRTRPVRRITHIPFVRVRLRAAYCRSYGCQATLSGR